jgi:hypothetical protein
VEEASNLGGCEESRLGVALLVHGLVRRHNHGVMSARVPRVSKVIVVDLGELAELLGKEVQKRRNACEGSGRIRGNPRLGGPPDACARPHRRSLTGQPLTGSLVDAPHTGAQTPG